MNAEGEHFYTIPNGHARKPQEKVKVFHGEKLDKGNYFSFAMMRIIVGTCLAFLFVFKDLTSVVFFGILRLFTETLRWFVHFIIRLAEEITVTFVRVILRGVEELWNVVLGVILQIIDSGSRVIIRGLRQIIGVVGYSFVVVIFAVVYIIQRMISLIFCER